jgi:hypothetical protein
MSTENELTAETQAATPETQEPVRSGDENWWQVLVAATAQSTSAAATPTELTEPTTPTPDDNWFRVLNRAQRPQAPTATTESDERVQP